MLYVKTDAGRIELQSRTLPLSPSQRQVLILCDGERFHEDLREMMPEASLVPALEHLLGLRLLEVKEIARPVKPEEVVLTDAERFRAIVELATSMAVDLGFASRIRAQLAIERANSVADLTGVVDLLYKNLAEHGKKTPLLGLRLNKLKQLASEAVPAPA